MTDIELLENHRHGSDQAFADIVQRHLGWIYGVARRGLGDSHRAEDVAQTVFVLLHRKAPRFAADAAMIGWLHTAARFATKTVAREELRRKQRETEFALQRSGSQNATPASDAHEEADWQQLAPVVDEMVGQLSRADREAILLRYYRNLTFVELGVEIGCSEEAARKRVDRAVEKLRRTAAQKGFSCGATLPSLLSSQIRIAPPSGLLATSTVAATAPPGSALAASDLIIKKATAMESIKSMLAVAGIIAAAVLLVAFGGAVIWWSGEPKTNSSPIATAPGPVLQSPRVAATLDSALPSRASDPIPPLQEVIDHLNAAEHTLRNLKIEGFSCAIQTKASAAAEWTNTGQTIRGNAWYNGLSRNKLRINFTSTNLQENGAPVESIGQYSWNGPEGRFLVIREGAVGHPADIGTARIGPDLPYPLSGDGFYQIYNGGAGYSLNFYSVSRSKSVLLSDALASAPKAAPPTLWWDNAFGTDLLCVAFNRPRHFVGWWVDPGHGYALRRMKSSWFALDGTRIATDDMEVPQIADAGGGIWLATRGTWDEYSPKYFRRLTFEAKRVVANDPAFDVGIFTAPIPPHYLVDDQTTGKRFYTSEPR